MFDGGLGHLTYTVPSDDVALVDCIGPIPKELGQLDCLEELNLGRNGLNGEEEML